MTWILDSAITKGDVCEIVYSETTQDADGNDVVEFQTVKHQRSSNFELDAGGNLVLEKPDPADDTTWFAKKDGMQTDNQWHANIEREIGADLSYLNRAETEPAAVDITAQVRGNG